MMDAPERPEPELTAEAGPWGGRAYSRRGAEIRRLKGGHVCGLLMEGCPLHGATFGVAVAVTPSEDLWVEEGRLPSYLRVVPKPSRTQPAMTEADARAALAAFDGVGALERWIPHTMARRITRVPVRRAGSALAPLSWLRASTRTSLTSGPNSGRA